MAASICVPGRERPMNGGQAAVHYAKLGYPTAAIKEILGPAVSEETITHAVMRARRDDASIKRSTSVKSKIGALWVAGMTVSQIADELGLPVDAVEIVQRRIMREAGVKP